MTTKLKPIKKNILVQLAPRAQQSEGGIAIPAMAQKAEQWGEVVAVGEQVEFLSVGEEAFIPSYLGTHYVEEGKDFILIDESKVVAKRDNSKGGQAHE